GDGSTVSLGQLFETAEHVGKFADWHTDVTGHSQPARGERRVGETAGFKRCVVLGDRDFDCAVLLTKLSNLVSDLLGRVANGLTTQHRGFRDDQTRWATYFDCLNTRSGPEVE